MSQLVTSRRWVSESSHRLDHPELHSAPKRSSYRYSKLNMTDITDAKYWELYLSSRLKSFSIFSVICYQYSRGADAFWPLMFVFFLWVSWGVGLTGSYLNMLIAPATVNNKVVIEYDDSTPSCVLFKPFSQFLHRKQAASVKQHSHYLMGRSVISIAQHQILWSVKCEKGSVWGPIRRHCFVASVPSPSFTVN